MLSTFVAALAVGLSVPNVSPNTVRTHLELLTSDELAGRMTLSPGSEAFAKYAAAEFKKYGLSEGPNKGYFHTFEIQVNQRATDKNTVSFESADGKRTTLALTKEFVPLVGSSNLKTVTGDVVFVGYGLTDEDWDDYKGVDVSGKVVMMFRGMPEGRSGRTSPSGKAREAVEKGAVGIVFVGPTAPGRAPLPPYTRGQGIPGGLDTVGVAITDKAFERVTGLKYADARNAKGPQNKVLGISARLITETEPNKGNAINIIGYLPGHDPVLKNEYIIIGAHYDHLGYAETGSRTGNDIIHPGADDNGSGSAGLLALAEAMSKQKDNKRTIIFQLYTGEELGLRGSNAWCADNPEILAKTTAMLNMDMIGTVRFNDIYVFGTSTSAQWEGLLDQVHVPELNLVYRGHLRGDSDQASFGRRNVPALFFHSMLTETYHTENDTLDKVNLVGAAKVCDAVGQLALIIDKQPKLAWNTNANLRGRNDDRVIPEAGGKSERQAGGTAATPPPGSSLEN